MAISRLALLALLSLSACSKFGRLSDEEKVTSVSLGSSRGPHIAAPQNGGVMIWGVSAEQKVAIALPNESTAVTKSLRNGSWTFYSVGWAGPSALEGMPICGSTQKTLEGTDTTVTINLSMAGCSNAFFGTSGAPKPLRLVTCNDVSTISAGGLNCDNVARGDFQSFKVAFQAFEPTAVGETPVLTPGLSSGCFNTSVNSFVATTPHAYPSGAGPSSPIAAVVQGYSAAGCAAVPQATFPFPNGLKNGSANGTNSRYFDHTSTNDVYLEHGPVPPPSISNVSPISGGWGGKTEITITGTNLTADSVVRIGGVVCPAFTHVSLSQVKCKPALSMTLAGFPITLTRGDGQTTSYGTTYQYVEDGFGNSTQDFSIAGSFTADTVGNFLGRAFHTYRNVSSIDTATNTLTLSSSYDNSVDIMLNDYVLWHVSAAGSAMACNGSGTVPVGTFGFAKVIGTPDATHVQLDASPFPSPENTNIGAAPVSRITGNNFCVLQIVRFNPLNKLQVISPSVSITAPPFDLLQGHGGILIVRANEGIELQPSFSLRANGKGFAGGAAPYTAGDGILGKASAATPAKNGTGGGGSDGSGSFGAGGGGGAGNGGSGYLQAHGGDGIPLATCNPANGCALFGGGGGGGNSGMFGPGGNGGGIVLVYARELSGSGSGGLEISADGVSATSAPVTAGGGGGTIFFQTAKGNAFPVALHASGGAGSNQASAGGAGGGGGRVVANHCTTLAPTISPYITGGAPGTGPGPATPGSVGEALPIGLSPGTAFCP